MAINCKSIKKPTSKKKKTNIHPKTGPNAKKIGKTKKFGHKAHSCGTIKEIKKLQRKRIIATSRTRVFHVIHQSFYFLFSVINSLLVDKEAEPANRNHTNRCIFSMVVRKRYPSSLKIA